MTDPGVVVTGLKFSYGTGVEVLRGVDFAAPRGQVTALVGPNGSGKSTLLKTISGYLKPKEGSVTVCGEDPFALPPEARSALIAYCGDEPEPAFDFTVEETVQLGRVSRKTGDVSAGSERAMTEVGVLDLRRRPITALSSGERQRAYLARALCQDPEVFLLDEPTSHLDMAYELQIMEIVARLARQKLKTVVSVHHDLNLALRYASTLFFLKDGVIRRQLEPWRVTAEVIADVYGVKAAVLRHPSLGCPVVVPESPL